MTIEIIIVHPPDYNEQANLPVVSLLSLREKDGLSMGLNIYVNTIGCFKI